MSVIPVLALDCLVVVTVSLAGGWIPLLVRLTHRRMQMALSFVAGVMLGVGLLHLIPHAGAALGSYDRVVTWTLFGILAMFFIERLFHSHQHHVAEEPIEAGLEHTTHDHAHHHPPDHHHPRTNEVSFGWIGAAVGLVLHGMVDGVALAAAVNADWNAGHHGMLAGIATLIVIVLHKPFDAMTLGTLLAAGNHTLAWRHMMNAVVALAVPAGVVLFLLGADQFADDTAVFVGCAMAFAAGNFICIALSDLLPELHFHQHDRLWLSCSLLLGLAVAWGIGIVEGTAHGHDEHRRHEHLGDAPEYHAPGEDPHEHHEHE